MYGIFTYIWFIFMVNVGKENVPYIDAMADFVKSVFANMRESIPSSGLILRKLRVSVGTQMIHESDQTHHEFLYVFICFLHLHDESEGFDVTKQTFYSWSHGPATKIGRQGNK